MPTQVPLCVDLDFTLIKADLLVRSLFLFLRCKPSGWLRLLKAFSGGKAELKHFLAREVAIDPRNLCFHRDLLSFLKKEKEQGRTLVLVTGAAEKYAQQIAEYLGLFTEVLATSPGSNLIGKKKGRRLVERYGEAGFDYVGNAYADLKVWRLARRALVVSSDRFLIHLVKVSGRLERVFPARFDTAQGPSKMVVSQT